MDISGDIIWGNDDESEVYAEAGNDDLYLLFKFAFRAERPWSLPNRIIARFFDVSGKAMGETFSDRSSMRNAIYSSIRRVWPRCVSHASIMSPDVTVEIYEDQTGEIQYHICHESSYQEYLDLLLPIAKFTPGDAAASQGYKSIDYSSLIPISHLAGRGRTALVRVPSSDHFFVYKGIEFGAFLESREDFTNMRDVCYHEIQTISSMPPHPNIMSPSKFYVTAGKLEVMQQPGVCGMLHPFMERGSLDSEIKRANATGSRLTLTDKARWCYEMSSAVFHTHFVARTYHMDIKPANFLLNAENDVILIDWEQSGAPHYTLAPEADGTWDVRFLEVDPSHENAHNAPPARLIYKRYNGPPRENSVWSWPQWNVFPEWRERFPRALEAAETFSLGRTLWLLLEQVSQSEIENNRSVVVAWSKGEEDIPDDWKAIVYRCLEPDPNDRIGLAEVLNFWKDANKNYPTNSPQTSS